MNIFKSLDYHVESGTTIAVGFKSSCSDLQNNTKPAENDNGFACGGASVARILKATIETKQ